MGFSRSARMQLNRLSDYKPSHFHPLPGECTRPPLSKYDGIAGAPVRPSRPDPQVRHGTSPMALTIVLRFRTITGAFEILQTPVSFQVWIFSVLAPFFAALQCMDFRTAHPELNARLMYDYYENPKNRSIISMPENWESRVEYFQEGCCSFTGLENLFSVGGCSRFPSCLTYEPRDKSSC